MSTLGPRDLSEVVKIILLQSYVPCIVLSVSCSSVNLDSQNKIVLKFILLELFYPDENALTRVTFATHSNRHTKYDRI